MPKSIRHLLPAGAALLIALSSLSALPAQAQSARSDSMASMTYSMAQAKQIAVKQFAIASSYTLTQESFNSNMQQGEPSYSFSFSYTTPDNQTRYISVTIGANSGTVQNYYRNSTATGFVYPLPVSANKAQALAIQWAKRLYPKQYPQVQLQALIPQQGPLTQPVSYTFNFTRLVQGVPAPFDGFSMTIDQNGQLTSVNDNWTQAVFPSTSNVLSLSRANAVYAQSLHLYLGYSTIWSGDAKQNLYLTYQSPSPAYPTWWNDQFGNSYPITTPVIDAKTGQVISTTGAVVTPPVFVAPTPVVKGGPTLYPGDGTANWTQAQALAAVRSTLQLSATDKLLDVSENQSLPAGDVSYNFDFKDGVGHTLNVGVDATAGYVTSMYGNVIAPRPLISVSPASGGVVLPSNKPKTKSQKIISAAAAAFIMRVFAKDTGGLAVTQAVFLKPEMQKKGVTSSFSIEPLINGVPMLNSMAQLSINPKTGVVDSFYSNFPKTQSGLPSPTKALSIEKAISDWQQIQPLHVTYLLTQPQNNQGTPKVVLAYAPVSNSYSTNELDAITGKFISQGISSQPYAGKIRDLHSVAAADQINLLVSHGLLPVSAQGDVHPNSAMTRAQFVKLVVDTLGLGQQPIMYNRSQMSAASASTGVGQESPAFTAIATAFTRGWIQKGQLFHPNQLITRGDAAQILARALGYAGVLGHANIFTLPAKDAGSISRDQLAGDAIAYALGMLPLEQGNFVATGHVTVAQAAVAVVQMVTAYSQGQQLFSGGSAVVN